jgi:hypothetical protein
MRPPLLRPLANQRGAVLFAVVLAMLLLSTMLVAFAVVARDEVMIAQNDREAAEAEFAAEAGANHGRWVLAQRLRTDLQRQVAATPRATLVAALQGTYNTAAGAAQFLTDYAIPLSGPAFGACGGTCPEPVHSPVGEIPDGQQVVLTLTGTSPTYTARVIVGVPPAALPVISNGGTSALFTYMWRIESTGTGGRATYRTSQDSVIATLPAGTFTIALNSSFVQYAHFIDQMTSSQAWISFRHNYTGPVHTNTRFNILGNPTGPTFRSEATQTFNDTRFNNGGAAVTQARDSTANDWPLLGDAPGVLCKVVDCTGFTRNYDFDPTTGPVDPIPFPAGANPADRQAQINAAVGGTPPPCLSAGPPVSHTCGNSYNVVVGNTNGLGLGGNLNGGIFVNGAIRDLHLDGDGTGQQITIVYRTADPAAEYVTTITENRTVIPHTTTVLRQCRWSGAGAPACNSTVGGLINDPNPAVVAANPQVLIGSFSPDNVTNRGVLFTTSTIGVAATEFGLRQEPGALSAIYQNPANPADGMRLTVVADGSIWITGHLAYRVEPRGPDLVFDSPLPGGGDDQLDVQNTLGVVSWSGGLRLSSWLSQANLGARYPTFPSTDLALQGMFMAPNLPNGAAPNGQISFDDPSGVYRGIANLLGGVVQKTMGTFGSPGTPGTGYARNWVYDERFRHRGLAPPAFPGFPRFTAATSLGIDSYTWRGGAF